MFAVISSFLMPFIGLSVDSILGRVYFEVDSDKFGLYVGNVMLIFLLSLVPLIAILAVFAGTISELSNVPYYAIWLVLLFACLSFVLNIVLTILRVKAKAKLFGFYQIGQTIINLCLSLWLVVHLSMGWHGRIYAQIFAVLCLSAFALLYLKRSNLLSLRYDKNYFRDCLKFGVPLLPHTLGAILLTMSDRFFITNMVGIEATGLYAVGYTIGNIIGFVENSFNQAYVPWLFEKLGLQEDRVNLKIVRFTYAYFVAILLCVITLTAIVPYLFDLFIDKKFTGSRIFVFWIALSFAFSGMYKMVTNYIFYVKKTHLLAWVTFSCSILSLGLNFVLIKSFGALGAAISASMVSLCFFVFTWYLSSKVFQMPWFSFKQLLNFKN